MAKRDPIALLRGGACSEFGIIDQTGIEAIREAVEREIAEAHRIRQATARSPDVRDTEDYVYTEPA